MIANKSAKMATLLFKKATFENKIDEPTIVEVKTGDSPLSEAQRKQKR
jgi:hypothetical protein